MSRRYELFQFRKYQNPWKRACSTKNSRKEIWTGSLIGHTLLSIFRISFVRDRIFSPFDSRLILIREKSVLPFFFFFFFVCFKLRLEVFIWIERYFVIFKWRNRVNNRRDNGADMSTCKLREIHSHVRAKHVVRLVAPMGVIWLIIYHHRVVFMIFVSQAMGIRIIFEE